MKFTADDIIFSAAFGGLLLLVWFTLHVAKTGSLW
jgi:hypothetical protein